VRVNKVFCPLKFRYARRNLSIKGMRILDIGCGNNSPTLAKRWLPGSHYSGADIQRYNNSDADLAAMDNFYLLGVDGSGYDAIPDGSFDLVILHHVLEHMFKPNLTLSTICQKLKPGGYIWIAFPSLRSLSLPSAKGTLQFCDDDTHVYLPDIREVSNVLLANGFTIKHAGTSRDIPRALIGAALLPWALGRKLFTGKLSEGLWHILGFEDHVFGQRKLSSASSPH
jgi:2-polyprenyl-3-methyl-5-hydroxy-6-metoxy-1,4-benzoquinol methylase